MNKDIIYIDVEDDITAIIGKVKAAEQKVVALVPPKRVGVLQSAVNLRLLARAAGQSDKRLVLITNNSALAALAASAKLPVAKNLQSKPEIASISALDIDDGEDIIDGAQLPVGELARTADASALGAVAFNDPNVSEDSTPAETKPAALATPPKPGEAPKKPKSRAGKVPNFNRFRKKLALIIAAVVLFIGFLVWAFFFAPRATVVLSARTNDSSISETISLSEDVTTDASAGTIRTLVQRETVEESVDFEATGSKEVGDEASGQVVFENCESFSAQTVESGTAISANGRTYITQGSVDVPGGSGDFSGCSNPGTSEPVKVVAQDIGEGYNTGRGTTFSVAGHSGGDSRKYFRATAQTAIDGGSKREITIVTEGDVSRAREQLGTEGRSDAERKLQEGFDDSTQVIDGSFTVDLKGAKSSPAVGQEVKNGRAKLSAEVVYSLSGVTQAEIDKYLDAKFAKELEGQGSRQLYSNGADTVSFTSIQDSEDGLTATLSATAQVGPKIDEAEIKRIAAGKRYGEIQSNLESIQGVDSVDVKFWPFWVSQAPGNTDKIKIEFNLNESDE